MNYDVVIIGAGPAGLAAAARLCHFGVKVCLLEAHYRLGGMNSWHHVRGREISTGLHAFTNYYESGAGGPLGKLLRQLRLKLSDLALKPQRKSSIRFPSATLEFTNDPEFLRQQVAETFPDQIDGFDRFRAYMKSIDEGELTLKQSSARDMISRYLTEPLLVDMLFCPAMYYGNPGGVGDGRDAERGRPDMDWLLFCVIWRCMFESGICYPAHGMRPLWETLAKRIQEDGGDIRMKTKVERLIARDGKVAAAVLSTGEEITGTIFLSSAGGRETQCLLEPCPTGEKAPAGSISIVEGICLLDEPPETAGVADTIIFYSFEDEFRFERPSGLVNDASGVICVPGNYLPFDATSENIIKVSQLASYPVWKSLSPEAYEFSKQDVGAGMARVLGLFDIAPVKARQSDAVGKYAIFDDLFTPLTLERFTLHAEGAMYGSPVKSRPGETSCSNLFLTGADQGFHGIVGAMLSGVAMANLHYFAKHG